MRRLIWCGGVLVLVCAGLFGLWKGLDHGHPTEIARIQFNPDGVRIFLTQATKVERAVVRSGGRIPFDQSWPRILRKELTLKFRWQPGSLYHFNLSTDTGLLAADSKAPKKTSSVSVVLAVPFTGLTDGERQVSESGRIRPSQVIAGLRITSSLVITNHETGGAEITGVLRFPTGLDVALEHPTPAETIRTHSQGCELSFKKRFSTPDELFHLPFFLTPRQTGMFEIQGDVHSLTEQEQELWKGRVCLKVVTTEEYSRQIRILGLNMPTTENGLLDWKNEPDSLFFKPPFLTRIIDRLGLGATRPAAWQPYTFQTVSWKNDSDYRVNLMVRSRILHSDQDQTPEAFFPPDIYTGTMRDMSVVTSAVAEPGEIGRAVMPIFLTSQPAPGKYRRKVSVFPAGASQPLATLIEPLKVSTVHFGSLVLTLLALTCCLVGIPVLIFSFKKMIADWKTRWIVVIALFGAVTFAVVNLPLRVFSPMLNAVLGPFSVFIIGFFNDLIYFSLLIALLRLIPRPGVATLVILVRLMIGGLTSGFHLLELLLAGSSAVFLETALFLSGPTRKMDRFSWTWGGTLGTALALGVAGALINATSIYMHMLLYRLYFAWWYVNLNVLFNGFVFTAIGVMLGKKFSEALIWAEE